MAQITTFEDFKLNRQLLNAIDDLGYAAPTAIQKQAIPKVLAGHDVMGIAQTGTGKTAAFVLPILMKVKYAQGTEPRALVLAPTRELILQIEKNIAELSAYCDLRYLAIYGGIGPKTQIEKIREGIDILVATPGRFLDLYGRGEIVVKQIKTLVLDEADKMMDMGFMPQIRNILEVIPLKRQNLLFSATMPAKVVDLSHEFLEFPEVVEVSPQATAVETVEQILYQVPNQKTKINFLVHLLEGSEEVFQRIIVFVKTKTTADNIHKYLHRKKMGEVRVIHANKGQNTRINSMDDFKSGEVRVLVATDVVARGIDVSMVSHVINFDVPLIYEDYVHRIGRTGRAQHEGTAITFANEVEMYHIGKIEKVIREAIPQKAIPAGVEIEKTPFIEQQQMAREMDLIKRKDNPDFKGAFHEKKKKFGDKGSNDKKSFGSKSRKGNKGKRRR